VEMGFMTTFRKQWRRRRCWPEEPPGGLHSPSKVVARALRANDFASGRLE
jgi:hypothetical protein